MHFIKLLLLTFFLIGCGQADRGKAYVTSQDGGVSVIDLNSFEVIESFDIGGLPRGLGITDDGKFLVAANKDHASITVLDLATKKVVNDINVGINPEFVRIKDGLVFVSTEPSSTGKPPAKGDMKHEEEEEDDDDKIPAKVAVVDLALGKKIRDITAGPETEGIEFSADGTKIIITNEADNTITVHDFNSGKLLKTVNAEEYGLRPRGIKVSPDGNYYVSTLEHSDNFIVLDKDFNHLKTVKTQHDVPEDNLHKGKSPYGVAFNTAGDRLLVAASGGYKKRSSLEIYDTQNFEKIHRIETDGRRCWHFSFTPDDQDILLGCGRSDEVLVIDANNYEIKKRIAVSGIPWGIVTYPRSTGSLDQK